MKAIVFFLFIPALFAAKISHKMGTLELINPAKKVVALEFSFVDALASLGVTPVAIADDGDKGRILPDLKIGAYTSVGARKAPSLEIITKLKPDLILADSKRHSQAYIQLNEIAPTMVLDGLGQDYDSDLENLSLIAKALGKEKELKARLDLHHAFLNKEKKRFEKIKDKKILFMVSWEEGVHIHTQAAFVPSLFKKIGLNYVSTGFSNASEKINLEQLIKLNPDILIIARRPNKIMIDEWIKSPLWKILKSYKSGEIFFVDQTLWTRMRGITSAEAILRDMEKLKI
jgi:iron complex transport system substrate-binding protein